ncbi:MAG: hydroxymyristoyl-ACP dehydratase [Aureispira sp.]
MDNLTPLAEGDAILSWIPQRAPMVLIDKVWTVDDIQATTGLLVQTNTIFCEKGYLQAPALAENIAQTAAAQAGYLAQQQGIPAPVGFIGAMKNLKILALPAVGEELLTQITIENRILNFTIIKGVSKVEDRLIAEVEMKIFVAEAAS